MVILSSDPARDCLRHPIMSAPNTELSVAICMLLRTFSPHLCTVTRPLGFIPQEKMLARSYTHTLFLVLSLSLSLSNIHTQSHRHTFPPSSRPFPTFIILSPGVLLSNLPAKTRLQKVLVATPAAILLFILFKQFSVMPQWNPSAKLCGNKTCVCSDILINTK